MLLSKATFALPYPIIRRSESSSAPFKVYQEYWENYKVNENDCLDQAESGFQEHGSGSLVRKDHSKYSFNSLPMSIDFLHHLGMIPETGNDYVLGTEPTINVTKDKEGNTKKALILTCSSDRGLCGAIHSSVSKVTRRLAAQDRDHTQIAVLGDKAKPQVSRDARRNIVMHFNQVGRNIPTFLDALVIWQGIRAAELDFEQVAIIYNRFVSAISFEPVIAKPPSALAILGTEKLAAYEYEPETVTNLAEYLYVSRLYWALVEGHAAEMSSKRTAMENATKNAEAIVVALTMKYNRTRQAVITNELVDIITGASAL